MSFNSFFRRTIQKSGVRHMSRMFETKNTIKDVRSKYYSNPAAGAENPTYLKEPGDKVYVAAAFTGMTVGFICLLRGLYSMSLGVNKL